MASTTPAPTTPPRQSWQFGRIYTPDDEWLATAPPEPILDPDLPIVDPHHHLWQRGGHPYLLDELLADLNTGHNIVATVFEECRSMYRADGPARDAPGRRDRVRRRHRRDERQRQLRQDPGRGRHRRRRRSDARRPGRAGAGGAAARRRRPLPRRAPLGRLGRRPDHRQQPPRHRSRISMRGRISAPASRGSRRSASASTPGSITRSSPT